MIKAMHYKVREHKNYANRMIGIALCGNWGRSLKNFTDDWKKVTCKKCINKAPYVAYPVNPTE